jgi:large subunit ribosomal protein L4e
MKLDVLDLQGTKKGAVELPSQFTDEYEPSIIKRAVLAFLSKIRQPYGADPEAGFRHSAKLSRRRKDYKTPYGKGMSRVPRKTMWRRGMQFGWVGAEVSGTKGGRRAHPPVAWKDWTHKINKKENAKAIRSALSGAVEEKKMKIIVDDVQKLIKTKEFNKVLLSLGFKEEIERTSDRKVRAGRGKSRGRKYKNKVGPLFVVNDVDAVKKLSNIIGFDVVYVDTINPSMLTKGHQDLRDTVWTKSAVEKVGKEKMFVR